MAVGVTTLQQTQLTEPLSEHPNRERSSAQVVNGSPGYRFCHPDNGVYFGGLTMRANLMIEQVTDIQRCQENSLLTSQYRLAFSDLHKSNKVGGSTPGARIAKNSTGVVFALLGAIIIGGFWSAPSFAYESGKFPGKGNKQAWIRAGVSFNQGNALIDKKNWSSAIKKYQEAIAIYPCSDGYFLGLGLAYEKRATPGDLAKAEAAYRKAAELCPSDWRNWNALANNMASQERYKECRDASVKAMSCNPPADKAVGINKTIKSLNNYLVTQK